MEILISGYLTSLANTIANKLTREKNKVVLISCVPKKTDPNIKNIVSHSIDPSDPLFSQALDAYHFDAIIYLAPREEQLLPDKDISTGRFLDVLKNVLEYSRKENIDWFFYISSTEVYGDSNIESGDFKPHPSSINGITLYTGEQYCKKYHEEHLLNASIIRVPFVYGKNEKDSLLYLLSKSGLETNKIVFPSAKDDILSFLHTDDIADFIHRALYEEYDDEYLFIDLSSSEQPTSSELGEMLSPYFQKGIISYSETKHLLTRPIKMQKSKQHFGWIAEHDLKTEIPLIINEISESPKEKTKLLLKLKGLLPKNRNFLKWLELTTGAGIMHILNNLTGTLVQFKYVDFRLMFVVLMGSVHGLLIGLMAASFAVASMLFSWHSSGLDWVQLIYNVENWLPISMYITAGAMIGYIKDKKDNEIAFQNEQADLIHDKYEFLFGIHKEITKVKDKFRAQVLGYRDSFGRIFNITQELETYNDEDVFLKALTILEQFLDNKNLSLYTLKDKSKFARLTVASATLQGKIDKSLNLADFPGILDAIDKRSIYQNIKMNAKYPAYAAPIFNDRTVVGIVVVWEAEFDQFTRYYFNLLKVISGLIQSSLVRAAIFQNMNEAKIYIPSTKIMQPETFKETLRVKTEMKNDRISDFQLLKIEIKKDSWISTNEKIQKCIRATDYVGTLDNSDCYVLLSQANPSNSDLAIKRLSEVGIKSKIVTESDFLDV